VNTRFYKYVYQIIHVLSRSFGQDHVHHHSLIPTVLEHFETQLRDPVFWQLYKHVVQWYWRFKNTLPSYSQTEIKYDGVKVVSVEADKLVTYFEKFDADITNAVNIAMPTEENASELRKFGRVSHYHGKDLHIKARQYRLAHLPFKMNFQVESSKAQKSIIRVYLGPKYDENGHKLSVNENRENYVLLDVFPYELTNGKNLIVRDSTEFAYTVKDRTTYYDLYKWVMNAYNGQEELPLETNELHSRFPNRLILPKGQTGGQTYRLFVHVAPYYGEDLWKSVSYGYPLDRKINVAYWYTPNMYYTDVLIYHKKETEVN